MLEWLRGRSKKARTDAREQRPPASPVEPLPTAGEQADARTTNTTGNLVEDGEEMSAALVAMHAARDSLWHGVGEVDPDVVAHLINPAFLGGPVWPGLRQSFRRITRPDGIGIVASDGLADPFDDDERPATGLGSEVYIASPVFANTEVQGLPRLWQFATLYQVAQNIVNMDVELGPQLERYGALSMGVPHSEAPADWLDGSGGIGVLIGVGLPGVPESISVPAGDVAIVGVVPLRPGELAYILDEGIVGRHRIADALRTLTADQLASDHRPSVLAT